MQFTLHALFEAVVSEDAVREMNLLVSWGVKVVDVLFFEGAKHRVTFQIRLPTNHIRELPLNRRL